MLEVDRPRAKKPLVILVLATAIMFAALLSLLPLAINANAIAQVDPPALSAGIIGAVKAPTSSTKLASAVAEFAAAQKVPFAVVVKNLKTGETASALPDKQFVSASLYKLFVAQAVLKMADEGKVSLASATPGAKSSIENCLRVMISESDNPCGIALGAMIGWDRYDPELAKLGFTSTNLRSNEPLTTTGDVGSFFAKLYEGSLLSPASTQKLLGYLKQQQVINRLPQGLPPGTVIAHKTGDLYGYRHDGGIVYGPKADYVIVAMSGQWADTKLAYPEFAGLSAKIYRLLNP